MASIDEEMVLIISNLSNSYSSQKIPKYEVLIKKVKSQILTCWVEQTIVKADWTIQQKLLETNKTFVNI